MNLKTKRRCTYAAIFFYNLCNGIEYAIIFPTIWNYVHERYKGGETIFGFIIAAYSISSFVISPLTGYIGDRTGKIKCILLIAITLEAAGSVMYFIGYSTWFLACSRLISGLGGGALAVVIADISHSTSEENRTAVLTLVVMCYQIGLLVGPGLNMFLKDLNFKIGNLLVDSYTSPGLFMAILWVVEALVVTFFYFKLSALKDEEDIDNLFSGYERNSSLPQEPFQSDFEESTERLLVSSYPNYSSASTVDVVFQPSFSSSVPNFQAEAFKQFEENSTATKDNIKTTTCKHSTIPTVSNAHVYNNIPVLKVRQISESGSATDNMIESAERFIQSASESYKPDAIPPTKKANIPQRNGQISDLKNYVEVSAIESAPESDNAKVSFYQNINLHFLREEIVTLLGLNFIAAFAQTLLETIVTPLVKVFYNFGEIENSLLYFCAAVEAILVYLCIRYASRKVSDRTMICFGIVSLSTALLLLLIFQPRAKENDMSSFPGFIIVVILDLLGIAVVTVCSASLLSKVVSQEFQALAQGFRRSMLSLGCILGPLWGGAYLHNLYALFSVPFSVSCIIGVLFCISFKKMLVVR